MHLAMRIGFVLLRKHMYANANCNRVLRKSANDFTCLCRIIETVSFLLKQTSIAATAGDAPGAAGDGIVDVAFDNENVIDPVAFDGENVCDPMQVAAYLPWARGKRVECADTASSPATLSSRNAHLVVQVAAHLESGVYIPTTTRKPNFGLM